MKLVKTMLWDEEPQKMDYAVVIGHNGSHNLWGTDERYFTDHKAWKARQVKPEPQGWILFKDREPEYGHRIITASSTKVFDWIVSYGQDVINSQVVKWCDYETYEKALQHYNENRLRYADFEQTGEDAFLFSGLYVVFFNEEKGVLIHTNFKDDGIDLRFGNGLDHKTFELICAENQIELKII